MDLSPAVISKYYAVFSDLLHSVTRKGISAISIFAALSQCSSGLLIHHYISDYRHISRWYKNVKPLHNSVDQKMVIWGQFWIYMQQINCHFIEHILIIKWFRIKMGQMCLHCILRNNPSPTTPSTECLDKVNTASCLHMTTDIWVNIPMTQHGWCDDIKILSACVWHCNHSLLAALLLGD